jgi:hypothetical protein
MMNIAEYLECTSYERNDLLVAAGYLPIHNELEGRKLELALDWAQRTMRLIPWPSMIVSHTQDIKGYNEPACRLFEIPSDHSYDNRMNRVDLHFSSDLPIRSRSTFDQTSLEQWESHAINGIRAFKRNHVLSRHDAWYQKVLDKARQYHAIEKYDRPDGEGDIEQTQTILARMESSGELVPIRYKQNSISASDSLYPQIMVFLPVDAAARQMFEELGCPADCEFL